MTELAVAAERAAENGLDSFAAQPCVFQDDMQVSKVSKNRQQQRPERMRRVQSEGTKPYRTATAAAALTVSGSASKLSVVELRDVNEVFPPFRQFHTHLRTHFFRRDVSQDQLLFDEPKADDDETKEAAVAAQKKNSSSDAIHMFT